MKFIPHKYQEIAIKKVIEEPIAGLLLDMGLGKTVSTLTAIVDLLHNSFEVSKVLVIAPKRVAEDTWSRETEKWDHTAYLKVSKILGSELERLVALRQKADIYVVNRENVKWLTEYYKTKWPFDMVVIDEFSSFKSSKSQRFRALRKVRPYIKRIVGLTGTPAPNGMIDLWPQIYLLDQGERLGKTLTSYRDTYFKPGRRNGHIVYEWKLKDDAEQGIYSKLSDICISMKAKDWLDLPERTDLKTEIDLPARARAQYKELEKELVLAFEDGDAVADTAAVLSNKLLQIANGAIYDEHKNTQFLHDEKLKAMDDLIEQANGRPVMVFYSYKHDLERLKERYKEAETIEADNAIARWNKGEIPILLLHPASAGHGLNLQDGGNIIVWFGLTWSLELYQQANARLHRQGQKQAVTINHIVAKDTVDEDVLKALEGKDVSQEALIQALKARAEKYKQME